MITATANLTHTPSRINRGALVYSHPHMPTDKKTNSGKRGAPRPAWLKTRLKRGYGETLRNLMLLVAMEDLGHQAQSVRVFNRHKLRPTFNDTQN